MRMPYKATRTNRRAGAEDAAAAMGACRGLLAVADVVAGQPDTPAVAEAALLLVLHLGAMPVCGELARVWVCAAMFYVCGCEFLCRTCVGASCRVFRVWVPVCAVLPCHGCGCA